MTGVLLMPADLVGLGLILAVAVAPSRTVPRATSAIEGARFRIVAQSVKS